MLREKKINKLYKSDKINEFIVNQNIFDYSLFIETFKKVTGFKPTILGLTPIPIFPILLEHRIDSHVEFVLYNLNAEQIAYYEESYNYYESCKINTKRILKWLDNIFTELKTQYNYEPYIYFATSQEGVKLQGFNVVPKIKEYFFSHIKIYYMSVKDFEAMYGEIYWVDGEPIVINNDNVIQYDIQYIKNINSLINKKILYEYDWRYDNAITKFIKNLLEERYKDLDWYKEWKEDILSRIQIYKADQCNIDNITTVEIEYEDYDIDAESYCTYCGSRFFDFDYFLVLKCIDKDNKLHKIIVFIRCRSCDCAYYAF